MSFLHPPAPLDTPLSEQQLSDAAQFLEDRSTLDHCIAMAPPINRISCPNLHEQLRTAKESDVLICSLLDNDPGLPLNLALARQFPHELMFALALLAKTFNIKKTLIPLPLRARPPRELRNNKLGLRLVPIRNDYPRSHPTLLIHTLLGRHLRPGAMPTSQGVLFLDVPAAIAIGSHITRCQPLHHVPFGLRDHLTGRSHLLWVAPSSTFAQLLAQLDISSTVDLRIGDILRETRAALAESIGHGELTAHTIAPQSPTNPDPCIRCAWCVDSCPTRLNPAAQLEAAQRNSLSMAKRFGLHACIECGICSYVCPSRLPLLPVIRQLKQEAANA